MDWTGTARRGLNRNYITDSLVFAGKIPRAQARVAAGAARPREGSFSLAIPEYLRRSEVMGRIRP
jgi:hypothetical protein